MTTRRVSRRVEQGDATRAALLSVARRSFGAIGYSATSLQSIVEGAGVTKGAFYHHFDGKREVFATVFEEIHHEIGRRAFVVHLDTESGPVGRPAIRDLSAEPNRQVFEHLIRACRTYLEAHTEPEIQRIVLIDGRSVLPFDEWHRIHSEHSVTLLRADLRRAMRRGMIRPLPLAPLAIMLAGALNEGCLAVSHAEGPEKAIAETMEVVEGILDGLRPRDEEH